MKLTLSDLIIINREVELPEKCPHCSKEFKDRKGKDYRLYDNGPSCPGELLIIECSSCHKSIAEAREIEVPADETRSFKLKEAGRYLHLLEVEESNGKVVVTKSPFWADYDNGSRPPWTYDAEGFKNWVWEVLLEGYKTNKPLPSLEEAVWEAVERDYELTTDLEDYKK